MLSGLLIPKMQNYYNSSRDRLSRLPAFPSSRKDSETSSNTPPEPFFSPVKRSRASTMHDRLYAGVIGPLSWSLNPKSRSRSPVRDPDLESSDFDLHDSMPNPLPTVHTLIAQGPDPRRPYTSEKDIDKIYVKREISTRETFLLDVSPIFGQNIDFNWTPDSHSDARNSAGSSITPPSPSTTGEIMAREGMTEDGILTVPSVAFFEVNKDERRCECDCHPGRVVSPAHLCGWCSPACY